MLAHLQPSNVAAWGRPRFKREGHTMNATFRPALAAAILLVAGSLAAQADVPRVPTASEQGITVPHALPNSEGPHVDPSQHVTAPIGLVPQASSRLVQPPNSLPGARQAVGEAQPHNDVQSPSGIVPPTGSERGADSLNRR